MNKYKEYLQGIYKRVEKQGVITNDINKWQDMLECDDLFYHVDIACMELYNKGVKEITTTSKCLKLVLNDNTVRLIRKEGETL